MALRHIQDFSTIYSSTPPVANRLGQLWLDTSVVPGVLRVATVLSPLTYAVISGGGLTGVTSAANGQGGYDVNILPQNNTIPNDILRSGSWISGTGNFAGQRYSDPVVAFGYNQALGTGVDDLTDPVASGYWSESDYSVDVGFGTSLTVGTTTTSAVVTAAAFSVNRLAGFVLFNVTRAIAGGSSAADFTGTYSRRITANTATTLTLESAIPGQVSGDVIQIHRRDMELYAQFNEAFNAGPTYRGIRPFMYTIDKSSLQGQGLSFTLSSGANGVNPLMVASAPHRLGVNDFVRMEVLTGGTWNANLEHRTRRVATVPSSTTFTLDNVNSTGFGTLTGGTCYYEPSISSSFLIDRNSGLTFSTASFRGNNLPAGATEGSGLALRFVSGILQVFPADSTNTGIELRSASSLRGGVAGVSALYQQYNNLAAGGWTANFTSTYTATVFNASGGGEAQAASFFRNNSENWGGFYVGANSGAVANQALFSLDGTSLPVGRPMLRIQQQPSPTAAAHAQAIYSTASVLQSFVDGVGNRVPRALSTAVGATDSFQYIPLISGAGVSIPTGVPANLAGNYANACPVLLSYNSGAGTYAWHAYINGGWRSAALT